MWLVDIDVLNIYLYNIQHINVSNHNHHHTLTWIHWLSLWEEHQAPTWASLYCRNRRAPLAACFSPYAVDEVICASGRGCGPLTRYPSSTHPESSKCFKSKKSKWFSSYVITNTLTSPLVRGLCLYILEDGNI